MKTRLCALLLGWAALGLIQGCSSQPMVFYTMRHGHQRVWPHFVDQPTVLAFWSPDDIESLNAIAGLNTLAFRDGPIQLITVSTGDRLVVSRTLFERKAAFEVIHDPEKKLAKGLGVTTYPTYILLDREGKEIDRRLSIRTINNWFDRPRWREKVDPNYDAQRYSSYRAEEERTR